MHDSTMTTFFLIIGTVGILVFRIIFYFVYKGVSEWNRNNKAPKISVKVFVKGKNSESHISSNYNAANEQGVYGYSPTSTTVTRTITFEDRDTKRRFVFGMERVQFDLIFEGDIGILTYQGTRFIEFKRDRS